ncbi:2-polyprenyl-6-methoxyphenol hydroxylase-like FAD-dependent oxidoreductase [Cryobacterium mesophilum]|uniref:FAD-dependent oxidoreductase n=1 Tax=Terrimesophilobacter mesophilus TaxID=433647 RepID=A0A4R8VC12_9MICO|nr:FAD-dependent oxidoreductase [Terrimesophilobacter mesophilus]MBB5633198.1 2-polyprenyl-6-methoxyphenol hydroxylase-like FAD-dependent oxidoreductase [Terrimesophilobacter mesophilus]TFB79946.1 FAD-dependent oxidoreductase [Terrimesophilobacter mesophilus]
MPDTITTTCCISGGGPAGITLGLLLARAGVDTVVLEKHLDFFRDFRGDTIHPSTIDLIDQLGLRAKFDAIPQSEIHTLDVVVNGNRLTPVDFSKLHRKNDYIALMPQWDFLSLFAEEGAKYPNFHLMMGAEATGILREGGDADARVRGVTATTQTGPVEIEAVLTVAADGRDSSVRDAAGLVPVDFGVAIDLLWFRLPRTTVNPPDTLAYLDAESMVITIPRHDYYQAGMLIPKGGYPEVQDARIEEFRARIVRVAPFLAEVVDSLKDWDQVKLLTVQVDRLQQWWQDGLLCIGDAAHAMSPAFGVGVNYAIQDAVASANLLVDALRAGAVTTEELARVQARRLPPVARMQPIQLRLHNVIAKPGGGGFLTNPMRWWQRAIAAVLLPILRQLSARIVGRGFRPEVIEPQLDPR